MPRRKKKSGFAMRKSRDKFGRSFTKFQLSCHEEVDAAFSDDEIEEELVDGFTNYRIVCDAECNCSQENVFGIDVATVNLDLMISKGHLRILWRS